MAIVLKSKPGLSSTTTLNIPKDWDPTWFRNFISNQLKGADVRNAVGTNGIAVSGTIASPYATISLAGGPATITGPLTINGNSSTPALIINAPSGQSGYILLEANGTAYGYIGAAGAAGAISAGSALGDIVIRSNVSNIDFSVNNGAGIQLQLTTGGSLISSGALQLTGYNTTGFAGAGVEVGLASNQGYLQAYNRTSLTYIPLNINASTVTISGAITFSSVATTTTAPAAGGAGALPATPKGYFTLTIGSYAAKVPYY